MSEELEPEREREHAERRQAIARLVAPQPIAQARPRSPLSPPPPPRADESGVFRLPLLQPRPLTREQRRSRRKREVRKVTENVFRLPRSQLGERTEEYPRPRTRGDCIDGPRPCPYVGCSYHLFIDVSPAGGVTFNFPDLEVDGLAQSCALDVADDGAATLEQVGALLNIVRERVRQIEAAALKKIGPRFLEYLDEDLLERFQRLTGGGGEP